MKIKLSDLRQMIREERQRMVEMGKMKDVESEANKTKEVDADEFADTLEKDVDHTVKEMRYLEAKERRAIRYIRRLREQKKKLVRRR